MRLLRWGVLGPCEQAQPALRMPSHNTPHAAAAHPHPPACVRPCCAAEDSRIGYDSLEDLVRGAAAEDNSFDMR